MLLERGACEDTFTYAFLGDFTSLGDGLASDASLAQANDPAVDALAITPIHHVVAGGRVEALRLLLACVSGPLINGARALRYAVPRENVPMVELLLERGADASSIGAGRWVVHPELAPMLSHAGARVDGSGAWIGLVCTGNQGRKDDPDYVAALLRYGARVDDRPASVRTTMAAAPPLSTTPRKPVSPEPLRCCWPTAPIPEPGTITA